MAKQNRPGGKKNRKIGQNKKKPCHVRYTQDKIWLKNKKKNVKNNNGEADYLAWCEANGQRP